MATLAVETITKSGLEPTFNTAASGGDVFLNDGKTFLYIKNGSGALTATITAEQTSVTKPGFGTITIGNQTIAVGANEERIAGPFEPAIYNNASGEVALGYDSETNVTVAVVKFL